MFGIHRGFIDAKRNSLLCSGLLALTKLTDIERFGSSVTLHAQRIPGMSGEKKHWRMSTPFRRFSGTQDRPKANVGRSGSRVSSVYLPDDSSTSGFIIVPEFDYPVQTQTTHGKSNHNSHQANVSATTTSSPSLPSVVDSYPVSLTPTGSQHSYLGGVSGDTSVVSASHDDDLTQRLGFAYEHIRSMPSAASPKVPLSSDPRMLRKQLGVPQHSVINYPIHSSPDLPNPHASPHEPISPGLPLATSPDVSHARISEKLGLAINMDTNVYPPPPHYLQDPIRSPQSNPVVTMPTQTKNTTPQCGPLGTPCSTHTVCTWRPQPSDSKQSKLVKRRVGKTISSPSSLPPSSQQASRGMLRKPGADTLPSANAHRRRTSLPQIRPPSPFRINIVSLFDTRHSTCNAVTSSSPFIMNGMTVEPILTLPVSVIPRLLNFMRQIRGQPAEARRFLLP